MNELMCEARDAGGPLALRVGDPPPTDVRARRAPKEALGRLLQGRPTEGGERRERPGRCGVPSVKKGKTGCATRCAAQMIRLVVLWSGTPWNRVDELQQQVAFRFGVAAEVRYLHKRPEIGDPSGQFARTLPSRPT